MNVKHKVQKQESGSGILPLAKRLNAVFTNLHEAAARANYRNEVHHDRLLAEFRKKLKKEGLLMAKGSRISCEKIFQLSNKGKGLRTSDQVISLPLLLKAVRLGQRLRLSVHPDRKSDPTHS